MKKNLLFVAITMFSTVVVAQTQSIVIQKNTLPNANQNFSFATAGPAGSAFVANPTITLHDEFGGKQPLEVGASAAGTGYLAFTQKDAPVNDVYTYASGAAAWVHPAGNNAVRIDIETSGINWQINAANNIYRNGVASGTAKDVGVGADNGVYIIGTDDKIYKWVSGSTYTALAGSPQPTGKRVDGGPAGTASFVGLNNHVYYYDGTTTFDRGLPGGQGAKDVAVGANGTVWTIAPNPAATQYDILYYWNGTVWLADALAPTGTTMYNVTVGADNEPLITLSFNGGRSYLLKRLSDGRWVEITAQTAGLNNTVIYYNQPLGNYSFTETVAAGYYLQDIIIFGSTGDTYSTTTGTSNIALGSGEHTYIQYTNVLGTKPAAQTIASACGSKFNEDFGTIAPGTFNSLPTGQTTYTYNNNPNGLYVGNGVNDGQYALVNSVFDGTGYYYQWVSGPGNSTAPPNPIHSGVKDASDHDHTGGTNGGMLLVNADFSSGVYYQKEYTGLVPGNSYQFSAWVANVLLAIAVDATDPNVILRVVDPTTGEILLDLPSGDIPKTGSILTWIEKKGSFLAPASGNIKVYLINNKPGGQGNDLVLDDISLTATCQTISGTIFNDANGMTDGLVNGTGTNTGSPLYAVLVDASNNIVASTLLPANGTYSFSNLFSDTYSVKITTTVPGAIGTIAPNASVTNGWLNTGDSLGNNNGTGGGFLTTGNLDSIRVVVGTTNVTGVDFGIERAPLANNVTAANQVNPGGNNTVIVPTLNGSDPEQGIFTGISNLDTIVIKTLPSNATLYYDFGAGPVPIVLGVNDTIKNYNPSLLTIDPNSGAIVVTFDYIEVDAALVGSNIAHVTMPFTTLNLSGNVFNDANGLADGIVNGTGVKGSDIDAVVTGLQPLYAQLLTGGTLVATVPVQEDGTYSFPGLDAGNYTVVINQSSTGASIAPSLPANWVNTGEYVGTGVGNDGVPANGTLSNILLSVTDIANVNFGIEQAPIADPKNDTDHINPGGVVQVIVPTLTGNDAEQGLYDGTTTLDTIVIRTLPTNGILYYNFLPVVAGDTIKNYNPSLLSVDPNDGILTVVFTYSEIDAALVGSPAATVSIPFTAILPITLSSFNAAVNKENVSLNWIVSSESNTRHYVIERSINNVDFISLANVNAAGNITTTSAYQFTDALPMNGINFYRLKIVDADDKISYSKIISIRVDKSNVQISVSPNPFANAVKVKIDMQQSNIIKINMVDAIGRIVYQKTFKGIQGLNQLSITDLNGLVRGAYIINVEAGEIIGRQKLIKR